MVSTENQYQSIFNRLKQNQFTIAKSTYTDRISKLKKLEKAIGFTYRESIKDVLFQDFRKPGIEVDISEIYPIVSEIRHIRKNLKNWLQAQKMPTPLALLGATSELRVEPKGVCLIISPWNFPFNLSFMPLCSAIAAGNTIVIKPSEYTKHSSSLIRKIVQEIFDEDEVTVIEGEAETAIELLKLPFNHIFFTGSPQTGKKVMAAAATNLADITLELGGKSPVIVDQNASIKSMAKRLVWGKYSNAGQICIAPDYVLVHEKIQGELLNACLEEIQKMYDTQSPDGNLSSIVNTAHFQRLKELLENSVSQGARPVNPLQFESDKNRIFPVL
nr:aldehyde dehydrogenase family protein [Saprospiraceae bacterium]